MKTRLAKFIANNGVASRRDAEKLITDGKVSVNGTVVLTPVFFVDENDKVEINGKIITTTNHGNEPRIIAFHKPINCITSKSDPLGRKTIYDFLPKKFKNFKYVGRLDYKTTGLLLLTNDGALARKMTLPETGLVRTYIAKLRPDITIAHNAGALKKLTSQINSDDSVFDPLRNGLTIKSEPRTPNPEIKYAPMEIDLLSIYPIMVRIKLTEGKKNEIRIAMEYIGLPVSKLHRESYGEYALGELKPGEWEIVDSE
ncbi:MAG: rRNA pseudouridine synthase [Alphaproteobacteria bacterium]|nr:rRNA pseudouridine synthase [Alphaproteobacteria bacterium]